MKNQKYRLIIITGLLVFCAFLILNFSTALAPVLSPLSSNLPSGLLNLSEACHIDGEVYEVKDAEGNLVTKMSRRVSVGDEILTGNGKHYKVTRVNGKNAIADFKGLDNDFIAWQVYFANQAIPVTNQESPNKIAIYHTHSEESYIPSDGTESIPGEGGIFKVGNVLREKLEAQGVEVVHAQSAHEPRDSNSYNRSRRTATELLRENPVALIDVHRDGVPDPDFYSKEIDGEGVTQIRLVVGRQNPKQAANEEFAKQIMAVVNENTPGLVKEIFYANGNYNQDLAPAAILLEVGTHTNSREAAERGVALFAESLPEVLGIGRAGAAGTYGDPGAQTPGGWSALLAIIGVVLLAGGAFILINAGGWQNVKDTLNRFVSREFTNLLMPRKKKTKTDNENRPDEEQGS